MVLDVYDWTKHLWDVGRNDTREDAMSIKSCARDTLRDASTVSARLRVRFRRERLWSRFASILTKSLSTWTKGDTGESCWSGE